jgi:hypothetical protein
MNKEQQRSFFGSIFNLRAAHICIGEETKSSSAESPAITISTPALLEALPQLHTFVRRLTVINFALTRQSDVQEMSNIILSEKKTLESLELKSIECPVNDCNKQDSNESNGFLDPLFYAATVLDEFFVSAKAQSVDSTPLVSPTALRALFVEGKQFQWLWLTGLGLTDSHVLAIVDGLSTPGTHLDGLKLESNPDITARGYGALFNLIDRTNAVGYVSLCKWDAQDESCVDEKAWEAKIYLVSDMNSQHGRLEYMTNGTFTSDERRFQWLERVVNLPISD